MDDANEDDADEADIDEFDICERRCLLLPVSLSFSTSSGEEKSVFLVS